MTFPLNHPVYYLIIIKLRDVYADLRQQFLAAFVLLQKRAYYLRNAHSSVCLSEYIIAAHAGRNFPQN